jgi:hypothetical protein
MKTFLVLLVALFLLSCSNDEPTPEPCQRIIVTGWNPTIGKFIKLKDGSTVDVSDNSNYQTGQTYCK